MLTPGSTQWLTYGSDLELLEQIFQQKSQPKAESSESTKTTQAKKTDPSKANANNKAEKEVPIVKEERSCQACKKQQSKENYSGSQWSKGVGTSLCKQCITESSQLKRQCAHCQDWFSKEVYTKNQWSKGEGYSCCKSCVSQGASTSKKPQRSEEEEDISSSSYSSSEEPFEIHNGIFNNPFDFPTGSLKHKAQDLCWDAFDTTDPRQKVALANKAIKLYPLCIDAHSLIGQDFLYYKNNPQRALEYFNKAVECGVQQYPQVINAKRIHYSVNSNRPYIRALHYRMLALSELQRYKEAVVEGKKLLRYNPNDNLGVRGIVCQWMFMVGDYNGVQKVIKKYSADSCELAWSQVLLHLARGEMMEADYAKVKAKRYNPYVPQMIASGKAVDISSITSCSTGSKEEAMSYAKDGVQAWNSVPGAMAWMKNNLK